MKTLLYISFIVLSLGLTAGCTSAKLIQEYKNPESFNFMANKVLVVGISANKAIRRDYEKQMTESLEKKNVIAVKSIDFFEKSFTNNQKSIEQLNVIENQLIEAGFDAILFTKVIGQESRVTLVDAYKTFSKNYQNFEDYYYGNQHLYFKEQQERYQVYTTETSLFCICPGKERELLWSGEIEVVDADKMNRNVSGYIRVLLNTLQDNNILIFEE